MAVDTREWSERRASHIYFALYEKIRLLAHSQKLHALYEHRPSKRGSNASRKPSLLDLPFEIRERIFLDILTRHPLIHIIRHRGPPRRLRAVRCQDTDPFGNPPALHHCWTEHLWYVNHRNFPNVYGDPKKEGRATGDGNVGFLGLLLVCRQIYDETINLVFQSNTFDLLHSDALSLLGNPSYLPSSHFHSIRHLRLSLHPSADFYHSQPRDPIPPGMLRNIYGPPASAEIINSLLRTRYNTSLPTNPFKYSEWILLWNIVSRMRSLATLEIRLNALCGPSCDFPSKCNLLRPLFKVGWRDAEDGLGLKPLQRFDCVVKWSELRFAELIEFLDAESSMWMGEREGGKERLPFRLVAEKGSAWGCTVPQDFAGS